MKLVVQRVSEARVDVEGGTVGAIGTGLLALLGISKSDTARDADSLLEKILYLRIFPDEAGKMNRNVQEAGGSLLIVSQFTLYGDCRKGRRPSFDQAAPPEQAQALYDYFVEAARRGPVPVATGEYRAHMQVSLVNDGPVTLILESA
jgi:D-aminoacyl-tRNA deacylase